MPAILSPEGGDPRERAIATGPECKAYARRTAVLEPRSSSNGRERRDREGEREREGERAGRKTGQILQIPVCRTGTGSGPQRILSTLALSGVSLSTSSETGTSWLETSSKPFAGE
jgi:hypothetical protein